MTNQPPQYPRQGNPQANQPPQYPRQGNPQGNPQANQPQYPQYPLNQPPVGPPQPVFKTPPKKKGHKGLLITGGVIALLLVAGTVNAANKPSAGSPQVVEAATSAPAVSVSTAPATTAAAPTTTVAAAPTTTAPVVTVSQQQAVKKAESYLSMTAFSRTGLIKQLEFEGFSTADSTYAVDHVKVDWTVQADLKAKSYMSTTSFSRKSLIAQLLFEGFTQAQAEHGATSVGL